MRGPRKYRRRSGLGPSASSFFSHQLNLWFFLKKTIIFKTPERVKHFPGGGGVKLLTGGGGGQSIRIQITSDFPGGGFGPPFPLWILA